MSDVMHFPQVLSLRGHFVDQNGQKWTVEVPQSVLEVHVHNDEYEFGGSLMWINNQTSQYCLRLIKDDQGGVLKISKEESTVEE